MLSSTTPVQRTQNLQPLSPKWEALDWHTPIAQDRCVMTETHYLDVRKLGLGDKDRARLNRLFACYTCELFVHFERYVIEFLTLRQTQLRFQEKFTFEKFLEEEQVHTNAFLRLLSVLRPDLYSSTSVSDNLRFMRWTRSDQLAIRLTPVGSFFLLAWLFEEITLFVPEVIDMAPDQCATIVSQVMRLHAREEQPHVAIDALVLRELANKRNTLQGALHTLATLPLLVHADNQARQGWKRLVAVAQRELSLSKEQTTMLLNRGPSQSDRLGMASFAKKIRQDGIVLGGMLSWILERQLRGA